MDNEFDELAQPERFGLIKIPLPVPPTLEKALGYPGAERYVAFHECRVSAPGVMVEDAHHRWPGVQAGWSLFRKHPAVARILEAIRLDLGRAVPVMAWTEWMAMAPSEREGYWAKTRYLVLDRRERALYVGTHRGVLLFLMMESLFREMNSAEDDSEGDEDVSDEAPDRCEEELILEHEPRLSSEVPVKLDRAELENLRYWLDEHEPLERDYTPGPAESCGFRSTNISVVPGQLEEAFGYTGGKRYVSLHWSRKVNRVFVCDGVGQWSLSDAVDTWNGFLVHPLIRPHLQTWDEKEGRAIPLDFTGHIDEARAPNFLTAASAHDMEPDVQTGCLLYDRAHQRIYMGSWASGLLFHSLVDESLEEDSAPASRPKPAPLLEWLDEHQEAPEHLFAAAASHNMYGQQQEMLATLRKCLEREPTSHLYWLRLSQALGSVSRWEEALEACDKALAFHATAPRQFLTASYMLKWKGQCLFTLQRYSEAADIYRFAMEVDDFRHQGDVYAQLARCYEGMGAYREAVGARELQVRDRADAFSEALKAREMGEVDDDIVQDERFFLSEAWFDLGRCHLRANQIEPAEWALRKAVEADARSSRARAELGALLRRLGHVKEAQEHLENALALANERLQLSPDGHAHAQLAFVHRAMGNRTPAENAEQRAAELGWKTSEQESRVVSLDARISAVGSR